MQITSDTIIVELLDSPDITAGIERDTFHAVEIHHQFRLSTIKNHHVEEWVFHKDGIVLGYLPQKITLACIRGNVKLSSIRVNRVGLVYTLYAETSRPIILPSD